VFAVLLVLGIVAIVRIVLLSYFNKSREGVLQDTEILRHRKEYPIISNSNMVDLAIGFFFININHGKICKRFYIFENGLDPLPSLVKLSNILTFMVASG
jgi:hypothetical protein